MIKLFCSLSASSNNHRVDPLFQPFVGLKRELQRQNKLISSERPFTILQIETKFIKIGQAVLEIFKFKDRDVDNFTRKTRQKNRKCWFLEVL